MRADEPGGAGDEDGNWAAGGGIVWALADTGGGAVRSPAYVGGRAHVLLPGRPTPRGGAEGEAVSGNGRGRE